MSFFKAIARFFGIMFPPDKPDLKSIVPNQAKDMILSGNLPTFTTNTIMLKKNEVCHYIDKAALMLQKKEIHYERKRSGSRWRLTKSYSWDNSTIRTRPEEYKTVEYTEGVVYVTNMRVVFSAQENAFEKDVHKLTSVMPYSDAITLQFGSETLTLITPQGPLITNVLNLVHKPTA